MIVGSLSENIRDERRVAVTPDVIKKYISLGLEVYLSKNYASHLGISDKQYEDEGARITENEEVYNLQSQLFSITNCYLSIVTFAGW